jgi:hypothetical protein
VRLILTQTRTYQQRSVDSMAILLEVKARGPGEPTELARRLGWDRTRVDGALGDCRGELRRGQYGFELTAAGRCALSLS